MTHEDEPIRRTYCAFWKKTNDNRYVRDFADLLRAEFSEWVTRASHNDL